MLEFCQPDPAAPLSTTCHGYSSSPRVPGACTGLPCSSLWQTTVARIRQFAKREAVIQVGGDSLAEETLEEELFRPDDAMDRLLWGVADGADREALWHRLGLTLKALVTLRDVH